MSASKEDLIAASRQVKPADRDALALRTRSKR
jgi:hypothetical protein